MAMHYVTICADPHPRKNPELDFLEHILKVQEAFLIDNFSKISRLFLGEIFAWRRPKPASRA
jgi:hypothetical protein